MEVLGETGVKVGGVGDGLEDVDVMELLGRVWHGWCFCWVCLRFELWCLGFSSELLVGALARRIPTVARLGLVAVGVEARLR